MAGPVRTPPGKKAVQPPRPPNAWILYRAEKSKAIGRKAQSDVSKEISAMWKAETPDVRAEYERRAEEKKAEHSAMYPQYRFQPVKKEVKERLREVKKQEKEQRKEAQRRGRANPRPSPAAQASRQYTPNPGSTLDPLAPYYNAEQRYGAHGPTPPMSAANSPSEGGTSEIPQSRVEESSASPSTHASPYPQTPSSVYGSPALPASSYGTSFTDSQSPEPDASSVDTSEATQWKDPRDMRPSLITTSGNWTSDFGSQEHSASQEFLSFDVPNPMTSWNGHNPGEFDDIQAILSATGDPSIFQLSDFDPQTLLDHPTGQLEISLGQMSFPGFDDPIPNLSDFPYYLPQSYSADIGPTDMGGELASLFPHMGDSTLAPHEFNGNYNGDEFLNFDENSSDLSRSVLPGEQRSSDATSQPYVPPAGAIHSSTRRVAGSWARPPRFSSNSPVEQSPTRAAWGVHA
ncbi:hypothetical protein C8R43DRAFT_957402 [Mycena crocata]|nr:hypothetical protein C8R43DRAFT_957402 [Mycena crocata]